MSTVLTPFYQVLVVDNCKLLSTDVVMFSYNLFSVIAVYSIRLVSTFALRVFIYNFDFV